jgi:hypothetical protein
MATDPHGSICFVTGRALACIEGTHAQKRLDAPSGVFWDTILASPEGGWVLGDSVNHKLWRLTAGQSPRAEFLAQLPGDGGDFGNRLGIATAPSDSLILIHTGGQGHPVGLKLRNGHLQGFRLHGEVHQKRVASTEKLPKEQANLARTGGRLVAGPSGKPLLFADDWQQTDLRVFQLSANGSVQFLFSVKYPSKIQTPVAFGSIAYSSDGEFILVAVFGKLSRYSLNGELLETLLVDDSLWGTTRMIRLGN